MTDHDKPEIDGEQEEVELNDLETQDEAKGGPAYSAGHFAFTVDGGANLGFIEHSSTPDSGDT